MIPTLSSMKHLIEHHQILQHPFLLAFQEGRLNRSQATTWLEQEFFISLSLANALASLYSRIPPHVLQEKVSFLRMISRKAWRARSSPGFRSFEFEKLAWHLHIDFTKLCSAEPRSYTQEYISQRHEFCGQEKYSVPAAIASVAFGEVILESYFSDIYQDGARSISGLRDVPPKYFSISKQEEEVNFRILEHLFDVTINENTKTEEIRDVVRKTVLFRQYYFDRLALELKLK